MGLRLAGRRDGFDRERGNEWRNRHARSYGRNGRRWYDWSNRADRGHRSPGAMDDGGPGSTGAQG